MQTNGKYFRVNKINIAFLIGLIAIGSLVSPASTQAGPEKWLAFGTESARKLPEVEIISASSSLIEIQAIMPGAQIGETIIAEQSYLTLAGEGYTTFDIVGAPALPVLRKMIEVPLGAEVSLELIEAQSQTVSLIGLGLQGMIAPVQPSQSKCGPATPAASPTAQLYDAGFYPPEQLTISDEFIVRGHRIVVIEIRPVRYNAGLAELETTSELVFRLNLTDSDMRLTVSEAGRLNSAPFNRLLEPIVLNYNQGRPVAIPNTAERYLIISADIFESGLTDFVTLKESQGFSVSVANLSTVGGNTTTTINNYIKTQYLGANPPDYVLLVGDYYPGNAADLTNYTMRTSSSYRTDLHYFTMDSDTEYVPDIFYGRFPVRTIGNLSAMIDKYEAYNGAIGDEAWVKKIEYLASNDSGYYQVAERSHNYVINNYTRPLGYTGIFPNNPELGGDKVYAITYGGTGAHAVASMNDNRAMLIYSGHGATTFWDAPRVTQTNIRNMTGVAIPYVASHACITADFKVGESFGDTWVIEPVNGALTFFGSSDSTYWTEDEVLEKAIFDHLYSDSTLDTVASVAQMTQYGLQIVDNSSTTLDNYYRETYHIFGDPSLEILMKPKFPDFRIIIAPDKLKTCNSGENSATINLTSVNDFSNQVSLSASTVAGFTTSFLRNALTPPGSTILTISGDGLAATGLQIMTVTGTSGELVHSAEIEMDIFHPLSSSPQLKSPEDTARDVALRPTFTWSAIADAESYQLEISLDAGFTQTVLDRTGIVGTTFTVAGNLISDRQYFWRVSAENVCGKTVSPQTFSFRTKPGPGDCAQGTMQQVLQFNNFEGGLGGWQNPGETFRFDLTTVRAFSPQHSVLASVPADFSDQRLVSPVMAVPNTIEPVTLIFWHRWTFDHPVECNDGGILEVSMDGGTTWNQVAKPYLLTTPYNGKVKTGVYNPLLGKEAWCNQSNEWVRTVVDLNPFKGKTVQFRFRLGTGTQGAAEGWYIDDLLMQTCIPSETHYSVFLPMIEVID